MKPIEIPGIPKQVTWQQVGLAIAALGIDARRVKSLTLVDASRPRVDVEIFLGSNPRVIGYVQIPIVRGEPVSTSEDATPEPAGNTVTMRLNVGGPVTP